MEDTRARARTHTVRVIFGLIHVYFLTFARFLNGKCRTHTNITHEMCIRDSTKEVSVLVSYLSRYSGMLLEPAFGT